MPLSPFLEKFKAFLLESFEATLWEVTDDKEYIQTVPMLDNSITFTDDLKKTLNYLSAAKIVVKQASSKNIFFSEGAPPPHILHKLQSMGLDDAWNKEFEKEEMKEKVEMFYQGYIDSPLALKTTTTQPKEQESLKVKRFESPIPINQNSKQKVEKMLLSSEEEQGSSYNFIASQNKLNILKQEDTPKKKSTLTFLKHPLEIKKKFTLELIHEAAAKGSKFIPVEPDAFYRLKKLEAREDHAKARAKQREELLRREFYQKKIKAFKSRFEIDGYTDAALEKSQETVLELEEERTECMFTDSQDLEFLVFFIELYQKKDISKEVIMKIVSELIFKKNKGYCIFYEVSEKGLTKVFPPEVHELISSKEKLFRSNYNEVDLRIPHFKDETFTELNNEFYYPYYLDNKLFYLGVCFFQEPPERLAQKTTEAYLLILRSLFIS